jgi:proline iminopeptidase
MEMIVDGTRVHYERVGSGPPLAVVHGGPGSDHTVFRPWLDQLSSVVELIYIDLLGNGRSDEPEGFDTLRTIDPWAEQLYVMREQLGFPRWSVMGFSFGGLVVQRYALDHPDELERLVLCSTTSRVELDGAIQTAAANATPEQIHALRNELFRTMPNDEELRRIQRIVFPLYFAHPERYDLASLFPDRLSRHRAYNVGVNLLEQFDFLDRLGELDVPSLVISAERDWTFPPALGPRRSAAALRDSTYLEIPESGHYPWVENTSTFIDGVRDWLVATAPAHPHG